MDFQNTPHNGPEKERDLQPSASQGPKESPQEEHQGCCCGLSHDESQACGCEPSGGDGPSGEEKPKQAGKTVLDGAKFIGGKLRTGIPAAAQRIHRAAKSLRNRADDEEEDIPGTGDEYLRQWSQRAKENLMKLCPNDFDDDLDTFKKEVKAIFRTLRHKGPAEDDQSPEGPTVGERLRRAGAATASFIKRTWKDSWGEDCAKAMAQKIVDSCDQEQGKLFRAKKALSDYAASRKPKAEKAEDNMGDKILEFTKKGAILAFRGVMIGGRYAGKVTAHGVTVATGKLRDKLEEREALRQEAIARGERIPTMRDRAKELGLSAKKAASGAEKKIAQKFQQYSQKIKDRAEAKTDEDGQEGAGQSWSLCDKIGSLKEKLASEDALGKVSQSAKGLLKKAGPAAEALKEKLQKGAAGMTENSGQWKEKLKGGLSDLTNKVKDRLHKEDGQDYQDEPIQTCPLSGAAPEPEAPEVKQGPVVDVEVEEPEGGLEKQD